MTDATSSDRIELRPEEFSVDELRAVVFGDSRRLPKVFALSLLRRKDYPAKVSDLERVAASSGETPAMRTHAVVELSRVGSDDAVEALRRLSGADHAAVRDSAVRRLAGLRGARETMSPAASVWEAKLDAVRRGAAEGRFIPPAPELLLSVDPRSAVEVAVEPVPSAELERATREAAHAMVEETTREGALGFRARQTSVLFLPSVRRPPTAMEALLQGPAILGSVLIRHAQEADRWEVAFHAVTQPSDADPRGIDIFVFRPGGELTFFGRGTFTGPEAAELTFQVQSVAAPSAFPIDVAGRVNPGGVRLERVRMGTVAATVAPQPRPR